MIKTNKMNEVFNNIEGIEEQMDLSSRQLCELNDLFEKVHSSVSSLTKSLDEALAGLERIRKIQEETLKEDLEFIEKFKSELADAE